MHESAPETLPHNIFGILQSSQRTPQLLRLLPDDVWPEISLCATSVSFVRDAFRQIQHDSHWQTVKLTRNLNQ